MSRTIVVGTRSSPLALRQTEEVLARLRALHPGLSFEVKTITTQGDTILDRPLPSFGGRGVFVKEVEVALQEGSVDVAVHSLKDVPTQLPPGLTLAAVTSRRDPSDCLVLAARHREAGRTLDTLPEGARIGTGSLRRAAQLRAYRPDLRVESVRGNLQTRLRKLDEEGFDALVLAAAGLQRLGMDHLIAQLLPPEVCLPAPGQGALALETRADDTVVRALVEPLGDPEATAEVISERALLAALGGGCHVPVGARGHVSGGVLRLQAVVASADGSRVVRGADSGAPEEAEALGYRLAEELLRQGARELLEGFAEGPER